MKKQKVKKRKQGSGGARPGAGRKPLENAKNVSKSLTKSEAELIEKLRITNYVNKYL